MNLSIITELQVKINNRWIPFSIFEEGKHKKTIQEWFENHQQMDTHVEYLVLAEALGTDVRLVDEYHGVAYEVRFKKGKATYMATVNLITKRDIKKVVEGAHISEDFESELSYILEV